VIEFVGDDVGAYGLDIKSSFPELLDKLYLLDRNSKIRWNFNELDIKWMIKYKLQLLKFFEKSRIKKINVGVQSGSKRILKLMCRYDKVDEIIKLLTCLKRYDVEIAGQFIVGFPSETEADLRKTLELIKKAEFNKIILSPYSDEEDTGSYQMKNKLNDKKLKQRLYKTISFLKKERIAYIYSGFSENTSRN
jgi:tRNA-2-methylthio-N6-dimethylallyladenosine synthase